MRGVIALALFVLCANAYLTPKGESGCVTVVDESGFHVEHVGENLLVTTSTKQYL